MQPESAGVQTQDAQSYCTLDKLSYFYFNAKKKWLFASLSFWVGFLGEGGGEIIEDDRITEGGFVCGSCLPPW